ncbi:MAG: COX15/CtaA family protein [Gemmatimonadota bacterium]|jgi:heme A synthase
MKNRQHPQAFLVTVLWTLGLLLLGSIVHATASSLACPDWPTCFGTLVPEMTGGVFWEHLHRLVAGGLILLFAAATWLAFRETPRFAWVRWWALVGIGLLLIQAVLGGVTVLLRLPDAVSTSHLALAFLFLALATILAVATSEGWTQGVGPRPAAVGPLRKSATAAATLAFLQSVLGATVRHTDAGMACPDVPLCLGEWIPPLHHPLVVLHFGHRALGVLLLFAVFWVGHVAFRRSDSRRLRMLGVAIVLVALAQVLLGFLSVYSRLAVVPVALHTLFAATLLTLLVTISVLTWAPHQNPGGSDERRREGAGSEPSRVGAGTRLTPTHGADES